MIYSLPLWIILAVRWLRGRQAGYTELDYQAMRKSLDDLYYSLPLPESRLEAYLVRKIIEWISVEQLRLVMLDGIGIRAVGVTKR